MERIVGVPCKNGYANEPQQKVTPILFILFLGIIMYGSIKILIKVLAKILNKM